jgi:hypothetical protein
MSGDTSRMRSDWNRRAREDANYYVAFGRRGQSEEEFQATAGGVVRNLERELRHLGNRNQWAGHEFDLRRRGRFRAHWNVA